MTWDAAVRDDSECRRILFPSASTARVSLVQSTKSRGEWLTLTHRKVEEVIPVHMSQGHHNEPFANDCDWSAVPCRMSTHGRDSPTTQGRQASRAA